MKLWIGMYVTYYFYGVMWKAKAFHVGSQSSVVYKTKGVSKVDVGYVYVLKGVFCIFQGYNLYLYLSCSLSLWAEAFLVVV